MEGSETTTNQAELGSKRSLSLRAEVDTSAPFESVKEAVTRFGGAGYWKPFHNKGAIIASDSKHNIEELGSEKLEEQAAVLEKELILKERETLDVLKELESTKRLVEDLKSKLQKEESEVNVLQPSKEDFFLYPSATPGLILLELKQAKLNLTKTTNDMADLRASVESLNRKLGKERISLLRTCERLTRNSFKISSLEEELNQISLELHVVRDAEIKCASGDPSDITRELQRLSFDAEHFEKMREAAKSQVLRTMSEIEQIKTMIRIAEIWLVAAGKMKVASRAVEAVALSEINALSKVLNLGPKPKSVPRLVGFGSHQNRIAAVSTAFSSNIRDASQSQPRPQFKTLAISNHESSSGECMQKQEGITLSFEEYTALTCKARDAEEKSMKRVIDAMLEVDEANLSKMYISKRVEEATEEAETCKKALEEALERVEAANRGKVEVEEALRKLRSEGHNDPSFDRQHEKENGQKQFCVKRKKFGFTRFSLLFSKQQKKKPTLNLN